MNHNEWIRLRNEGDRIVTAFVTEGYQVIKVKGALSWKIQNGYTLTWLPAPVGEWTVLPLDLTAQRDRLIEIIQSSLSPTPYRGTGRYPEGQLKPWAIAKRCCEAQIAQLLPNATRRTIARFFNRQDAIDHLRFLARRLPAAEFTMFFDPPDC
ncbi:MAG TPA: hypothetical protein DD379_23770 [Cyanobacteria bacterium UBA11162]|nr:hypothetical protein [Cyanobacteria bacterium UBA11162]